LFSLYIGECREAERQIEKFCESERLGAVMVQKIDLQILSDLQVFTIPVYKKIMFGMQSLSLSFCLSVCPFGCSLCGTRMVGYILFVLGTKNLPITG
jgi:hypothetical protein